MVKTKRLALRSPSKWPGGKSYLVHKFIPLAPPRDVLLEPYFGMGSFTLRSDKSSQEIAVDLSPDVINFWKHVQADVAMFAHTIESITYSIESFLEAKRYLSIADPHGCDCPCSDRFCNPAFRHAVAFFTKHRMSRGGDGRSFSTGTRLRRGMLEGESAWETIRNQLPLISERVKDVEFRCGNAIPVIEEVGRDRFSFIYADPVYLKETRVSKDVYDFEMTVEDHVALLKAINSVKGGVMLSGYPSQLYEDYLGGWDRKEFKVKCSAGQTKVKSERIEVLWRNQRCVEMNGGI